MNQAEVDRVKTAEAEEEDTSQLDALDDPVRMYLKQMGQVALLTRQQEVDISQRIEAAENEVRKTIYSLGFAGKEHIALAEKLLAEPPRQRFDRVILEKKVDDRRPSPGIARLVARIHEIDEEVDHKYIVWRDAAPGFIAIGPRRRSNARIKNYRPYFPNFAANTRSRGNGAGRGKHPRQAAIQPHALAEVEAQRESSAQQHLVEAERRS